MNTVEATLIKRGDEAICNQCQSPAEFSLLIGDETIYLCNGCRQETIETCVQVGIEHLQRHSDEQAKLIAELRKGK